MKRNKHIIFFEKVSWKGFEVSPHVQHIHTHPEEYVEAVNKHLKANVPMLRDL